CALEEPVGGLLESDCVHVEARRARVSGQLPAPVAAGDLLDLGARREAAERSAIGIEIDVRRVGSLVVVARGRLEERDRAPVAAYVASQRRGRELVVPAAEAVQAIQSGSVRVRREKTQRGSLDAAVGRGEYS